MQLAESGQCCLHVQDFRTECLVLGNQLGAHPWGGLPLPFSALLVGL